MKKYYNLADNSNYYPLRSAGDMIEQLLCDTDIFFKRDRNIFKFKHKGITKTIEINSDTLGKHNCEGIARDMKRLF